MYSTVHKSIGAFQIDNGHWFTYRNTTDAWAVDNGYVHVIDVGTDASKPEFRYANVLKTRVHVVTDEDAAGNPVVETWKIIKHEQHE